MAYKASPRPTFSGPTHIPYAQVTRHIWGDAEAGMVDDWIYVSSDKIHQLVFGLAPGGAFRHSEGYRTVFGADEVLYVLSGTYVSANPETGEVHRAEAGEAIFFRKDTWHHGFNASTEPLRVLEFFAPPPSTGTSGAYAKTKPYVSASKYAQDQWLGKLPMETTALRATQTMRVLRNADVVWRMEGSRQQALIGLYCATEHLTVGKLCLLPGQETELETHGGDESLYVLKGEARIHTPEADGQRWFELNERDGFYIPQGQPHRYCNLSAAPVELLFGVAPKYR